MVKLFEDNTDRFVVLCGILIFLIEARFLVFTIIIFIYINRDKFNYSKKIIAKRKLLNCIVYFFYCTTIIYFISIASELLLHEYDEQKIVKYFKENEIYMIDLINTVIIAPIVEEIVFRGMLYRLLKSYLPIAMSMVISSFIFSIVHDNVLVSIVLFALGILLCFSYEMYKSICFPVLIHSLFNLVMLQLIFCVQL